MDIYNLHLCLDVATTKRIRSFVSGMYVFNVVLLICWQSACNSVLASFSLFVAVNHVSSSRHHQSPSSWPCWESPGTLLSQAPQRPFRVRKAPPHHSHHYLLMHASLHEGRGLVQQVRECDCIEETDVFLRPELCQRGFTRQNSACESLSP